MGTGPLHQLITGLIDDHGRAVVRLRIGFDRVEQDKARQFGHQIPKPQSVAAVIDTGCNGIEVSEPVINRLGLFPEAQIDVDTAAGRVKKWLYRAHIDVLGSGHQVAFSIPDATIRTLPAIGDIEALAGWPILAAANLHIDGPRREFTLSF